jgi:hypothetical protein
MNVSAFLKRGIDDIYKIEKRESYIKVISNMPIYKERKKNYPFSKSIGMNTAEIMSSNFYVLYSGL